MQVQSKFTLHAFPLLFFCIQNEQKVGYMVVNVIVHISACHSSAFRLQKKKLEHATFFLHRPVLERIISAPEHTKNTLECTCPYLN
ncbi:unnamed protein product [Staurois parvus]|uniref:Secreted protein n=1 Tax=Staurois parvus TaxID=386267 RepID=A0ABN9C578_9NEOB|nr:unnamed protein product [Staurois parvus]